MLYDMTHEIVPQTILRQPHEISRMAYCLPTMQRRILQLVMVKIQLDGPEQPVEMNITEVIKAYEMQDSGQNYNLIRESIVGLMRQVMVIGPPNECVIYHWVYKAAWSEKRDKVLFWVDPDLIPLLTDLQKMWARIPVFAFGRLQGKYSYRMYEIAMSFSGFKGRGKNSHDGWYVDLEFAEIREMMDIKPHEYKLTTDFKKRVIEGPIREINAAQVGLYIEPDYSPFRRGKCLLGVRLICHEVAGGDPRPAKMTPSEAAEFDLIEAYPDLYKECLEEAQNEINADLFGWVKESLRQEAVRGHAIKLMQEKLKDRQPKKRGRPRKNGN